MPRVKKRVTVPFYPGGQIFDQEEIVIDEENISVPNSEIKVPVKISASLSNMDELWNFDEHTFRIMLLVAKAVAKKPVTPGHGVKFTFDVDNLLYWTGLTHVSRRYEILDYLNNNMAGNGLSRISWADEDGKRGGSIDIFPQFRWDKDKGTVMIEVLADAIPLFQQLEGNKWYTQIMPHVVLLLDTPYKQFFYYHFRKWVPNKNTHKQANIPIKVSDIRHALKLDVPGEDGKIPYTYADKSTSEKRFLEKVLGIKKPKGWKYDSTQAVESFTPWEWTKDKSGNNTGTLWSIENNTEIHVSPYAFRANGDLWVMFRIWEHDFNPYKVAEATRLEEEPRISFSMLPDGVTSDFLEITEAAVEISEDKPIEMFMGGNVRIWTEPYEEESANARYAPILVPWWNKCAKTADLLLEASKKWKDNANYCVLVDIVFCNVDEPSLCEDLAKLNDVSGADNFFGFVLDLARRYDFEYSHFDVFDKLRSLKGEKEPNGISSFDRLAKKAEECSHPFAALKKSILECTGKVKSVVAVLYSNLEKYKNEDTDEDYYKNVDKLILLEKKFRAVRGNMSLWAGLNIDAVFVGDYNESDNILTLLVDRDSYDILESDRYFDHWKTVLQTCYGKNVNLKYKLKK